MSADEAFFLSGVDKSGIISVLQPDIFFDDQIGHLEATALTTPSVHVPFGVANLGAATSAGVPAAAASAGVPAAAASAGVPAQGKRRVAGTRSRREEAEPDLAHCVVAVQVDQAD